MFTELGYYKEYYIAGKFIGVVEEVEKDRDTIGFFGKRNEIVVETIRCTNGRIIKPGTEIMTIIYPLCGAKK